MTDQSSMLDTVEEAIEAIGRGEIVVVVDDEDRENEGDLIAAGVKVKLASNDRGEVHLLGCYPGRTGHKIVCEEIQPDKIIQEDAAAESPCPKLRVMVVNKLYMSHFIGDDQAFFI